MAYIYVMDRADGACKIGFSSDPYRRLGEVPEALSILALWAHDKAFRIEQAAHELLAAANVGGEWFAVERYAAFDAVSRAMREFDAASPKEILLSDLAGDFDVPIPPYDLDAERYRLAYLRPIVAAPPGKQMKWLLAAGVDNANIYMESEISSQLAASMKDVREGDLFFAWSGEVFGPQEADIRMRIADRGADLVTAL